jgi:SAM-dependent methyltransferase
MPPQSSAAYPHYSLPQPESESESASRWPEQIQVIAQRFNQEYQGKSPALPPEIEALPLCQDWRSGKLQARIASPFWELISPQKKHHCLDLGCGISFLVYPCWREWDAFFYGQEISTVAKEALMSRGPQLNSKLFKGVQLKGAHQLEDYETAQFDWVIATGVSCYYGLDYWEQVLTQVQRVLKPGSCFVFDVLDRDVEWAENWGILETYLGAEVFLEPLAAWESLVNKVGAKVVTEKPETLFHLYKIRWL